MGGKVDYVALPILMEMFGLDDVESLIHDLMTINDYLKNG